MARGRQDKITAADEPGSPWRFAWPTWKTVLGRMLHQTMADNIDLMAAGVAFYGFLALVPMLGGIVLTYGLLATPDTVIGEFRVLIRVMPMDAARLVRNELLTIVTASDSKKGLGLLLALALALFGARSGAGAIITALNLAYEEKESRGFIKLNVIAVAVTATGIVIGLTGIAAVAALAWLEALLPTMPASMLLAEKAASWLAIVAGGGVVAAALYRIGPDRRPPGWIWLTPGAVLAAVGWLVVTLAFSAYVASSGHYNATYGSLSAVVVILTWFYLSSYLLLAGAELNAECERQAHLLKPDYPGSSSSPDTDTALERKLVDVPATATAGPGA